MAKTLGEWKEWSDEEFGESSRPSRFVDQLIRVDGATFPGPEDEQRMVNALTALHKAECRIKRKGG